VSDAVVAAMAQIFTGLIAAYAAIKASRAEKNSRPISNGFAASVKGSLKHLEDHLEDVHKDVREVRSTVIKHIAQDHTK
jgi:hypothetical protein